MNNATRIASEASAYIRADKNEMALVRLSELINLTSYIISRWQSQLPLASKDRLIASREQLHVVYDLLDKLKGGQVGAKDRSALGRFCREIPMIFTEEYGKAMSMLDRR